jgi:peptide-methionine (S)-S-oxide reductase
MKKMKYLLLARACLSIATAATLPNPAVDVPAAKGKQTAVLAGGCFWCTEAVFEHVKGVERVVSGYAGGDADSAHYEVVGSGRTNHAESIQVTFDPSKITYGQILKIFFAVAHDPTQKDRQGPDWGRQYRSAVFYKDADQKRIAEAYIKQLTDAKVFAKSIATEVAKLPAFYPAEEYHQDFVKRNPNHRYVVVNSVPKVEKLKKEFPDLYREW